MKVRAGFVSNSSSSSFIIGVTQEAGTKCPHCGRGGTDILQIVDRANHYETCLEWDDVDEYIRQLTLQIEDGEARGYGDDMDWERNLLKKVTDAKPNFTNMFGLEISYHDNMLLHVIDEMKESGEIVVIHGD